MKYSKLYIKTKKNAKEYDSVNATLLQKGGFIYQEMAGAYTFLTLGLRVLNKIEKIIREEMDQIGSEVLMTSLAPKELWEQTGRLNTIDVLMKTSGANDLSLRKSTNEYILNCTHEDIITPIAKEYNLSYKDFPFAFYQIQTKFRNEARAKSGLMRGREFRMKDLYSFHTSADDLKSYYEKSKDVYKKVYERLGLSKDTYMTLASGGDFTKDYSHEFQTRCDTGEDTIFYVKSNNIAFNKEVAPSQAPKLNDADEAMKERQEIEGQGIIGVAELAAFLKIPVEKTTKTMLYETDNGDIIAAAVRGGYDINEEKLTKIAGVTSIHLAPAEIVKKVTKAEVGYAGVLDLPESVKIYFDESTKDRKNFECGANKTHFHSININWGRDIPVPETFYDFKLAKAGDLYPDTGEEYEVFQAAEVGNIFPLGTKFTIAINYQYTDENGEQKPIYMGSYGIGSSRLMGVIVEKFHDEKGIIWPEAVAPFAVHLVGLAGKDENVQKRIESVYSTLLNAGVEVLYDDREVGAGEKFADADLLGMPVRLVVSSKTGENVEWKKRSEKDSELISLEEVIKRLS
jgi:prolyl-tRNA synthetase